MVINTDVLSINQLKGDFVDLRVTNERHIGGNEKDAAESIGSTFGDMLKHFVHKTNELELNSTELTNRLAIDPESVDIHDVQIAAEEAEMAVLFTKGIVDRVIRAYKEITNLR